MPRPRHDPGKKCLRGLVIGAAQQILQPHCRFSDKGWRVLAFEMIPQPHLFGPRHMGEQIVLGPPYQRRGEQIGEAEIIERLGGKPESSQHVLHRQRRA